VTGSASTGSKLALWIGYGVALFSLPASLWVVGLFALPPLVTVPLLAPEHRGNLLAEFAPKIAFLTSVLFLGVLLISAAGNWPRDLASGGSLIQSALIRVGRIAIVLFGLTLVLATSTASGVYHEMRRRGVSPEWRATLLPAALFPKTLVTRLGAIREAQLAHGIDWRVGFVERPRIFVTTLSLLLMGTLTNLPERAAVLTTRGVFVRDPAPSADRGAAAGNRTATDGADPEAPNIRDRVVLWAGFVLIGLGVSRWIVSLVSR
jgi:hypothetical protein